MLASDLAPHQVPGTDLGTCLLASDLAPHRVPGTDWGTLLPGQSPGGRRGAKPLGGAYLKREVSSRIFCYQARSLREILYLCVFAPLHSFLPAAARRVPGTDLGPVVYAIGQKMDASMAMPKSPRIPAKNVRKDTRQPPGLGTPLRAIRQGVDS